MIIQTEEQRDEHKRIYILSIVVRMKYPILVADPDLQMGGEGRQGLAFTRPWDGGGGGRGLLSPDPGMGGEVGACFHQTLGWGGRPQFGLKISGGGRRAPRAPPLDPPLNTHKLIIYLFLQPLALATPSRYLLRRGDIMQVVEDSKSPLKRLKPKLKSICMFLFNDLLLLAKKKRYEC